MTDAAASADADPPPAKKKGKSGLVFGLVGALVFGGGGFYAIYSGMLDTGEALAEKDAHHEAPATSDVAFVPLDPIMISLPPGSSARHLRFSGQLEVEPGQGPQVKQLMPRIIDVLNTYLRAVEIRDLEQPSSAARLRAQMLRRVQVVTGEGQVRDLLIAEFVLN